MNGDEASHVNSLCFCTETLLAVPVLCDHTNLHSPNLALCYLCKMLKNLLTSVMQPSVLQQEPKRGVSQDLSSVFKDLADG